MPVVATFYGIIISMYFMDNKQHKRPHIHTSYQGDEAVFAIPEGDFLDGKLPSGKVKLVQAWIEIHQDELMAEWKRAVAGESIHKIEPLK